MLTVAGAATISAGACRKKPTPTPQPVVNQDSIDRARRMQDSIDAANRARQDSINAAAAAASRARQDSVDAANARMTAARNALTAMVYFEYDQSDITDQSKATLDAKLPLLNANTGLRMRVTGHTDSRGSDEYNLALGRRRAEAVKRYLTQRGIDASRIETTSAGEERPIATGDDESAWSQNRRAEFEITAGGETLTLPPQ
jgi:peptidoglycan-associated lipoprotein